MNLFLCLVLSVTQVVRNCILQQETRFCEIKALAMSIPSDQRPQEHSNAGTKLSLLIYSEEGVDTPQGPMGLLSEDSQNWSLILLVGANWNLCWGHPSWQDIILSGKLPRSAIILWIILVNLSYSSQGYETRMWWTTAQSLANTGKYLVIFLRQYFVCIHSDMVIE